MPSLPDQSLPMKLLRRLGRDDLAWTLRRLHVPVSKDALVLEVGSGGNPFPRSNVLLDAYENTRERHFQPLVTDRPTVLGLIEDLPFKDDAFDFVIACHVIEHSSDVTKCLAELQRVARAGYIECPDAFFERINPYKDHRYEVTERDGTLVVRRKTEWIRDQDLVSLYENKVKGSRGWLRQLRRNPFPFHVRYFWSRVAGGIRVEDISSPGDANRAFKSAPSDDSQPSSNGTLRQRLLSTARWLFSQAARNQKIDLTTLLRCVSCHGTQLTAADATLRCSGCGKTYPFLPTPTLFPETQGE